MKVPKGQQVIFEESNLFSLTLGNEGFSGQFIL